MEFVLLIFGSQRLMKDICIIYLILNIEKIKIKIINFN